MSLCPTSTHILSERWSAVDACRICGGTTLTEVLNFGRVPLADRLVPVGTDPNEEPWFPLTVVFCSDCSLMQLRETVDPQVLFDRDYPYYSSVSSSWVRHCRDLTQELMTERRLGSDSCVLEIASNDGYLLQHYAAAGIPVLGIDPAPGPAATAEQRGIPTRVEFFGRESAASLRSEGILADVIHAHNVLAHVADLHDVVAGIALLLKPNGVGVVEIPWVRELIAGGQFDTIYHEHLCYFSVTAARHLFARHGLHLNRVRPLRSHGGSLRLYVSHQPQADASVGQLLDDEARRGMQTVRYYADFSQRVQSLQQALRQRLQARRAHGRTIWGYAAAAKGAMLLNTSGITRELVECVVDRNPHKQGRQMPGARIPIVGPDALDRNPPDDLLLLAWNLRREIIAQQQLFQDRGGRFLIPVPRFEIV